MFWLSCLYTFSTPFIIKFSYFISSIISTILVTLMFMIFYFAYSNRVQLCACHATPKEAQSANGAAAQGFSYSVTTCFVKYHQEIPSAQYVLDRYYLNLFCIGIDNWQIEEDLEIHLNSSWCPPMVPCFCHFPKYPWSTLARETKGMSWPI